MKQILTIKCPGCDETIEIDTKTGRVEKHFKEGIVKTSKEDIFKKNLTALKYEEALRGERFDKLKEEKNKRLKKINERFNIEKEKVKNSPDDIKPSNPFDLD